MFGPGCLVLLGADSSPANPGPIIAYIRALQLSGNAQKPRSGPRRFADKAASKKAATKGRLNRGAAPKTSPGGQGF